MCVQMFIGGHFFDSRTDGLYPFRKWPVSALSFGQKKRVTIASILVQRPQVIILDEPTAGQDYHHYTEIMEFLKELNEQGFTILMITHDMHLMLEYTKRAIVFCKGKLLADTTSAHVLNDPELVKRLVEEGITLEVSVTSNYHTKVVDRLEDHPIRRLFDAGVRVTINSDNMTCSRTNVNKELDLMRTVFGFTEEEIEKMEEYAWEARFLKN